MTELIMQLAGVIQRDVNDFTEIANNVANANSVGFKSARTFNVLPANLPTLGVGQGLGGVTAETYTNPAGGALHVTGRMTDLALSGDGWFVLQTPDGARLTRDGRFRVDGAGYLVGEQGYPLIGKNGLIQVAAEEFKVDTAGVVKVGTNAVGQISVMQAGDPRSVQPMGGGLYGSSSALVATQGYSVHQGMQEKSNADMGSDMVRMMEISRHIETMQRAISAYDGLLDSGINRLGRE